VVSDGGELLGVTVSTLNAASLLGQGALPQKREFRAGCALCRPVPAQEPHRVHRSAGESKGDPRTGNEAALASVVRLSCFQ